MNMEDLRSLSRERLEVLFAERKAALLRVRDELDRRDREEGKKGAVVDFCKYVTE